MIVRKFSSYFSFTIFRPSNVGNGSTPKSRFCNQFLYDFIYKFHSHNILHGIWPFDTRLCLCRPYCGIFCYYSGSNWSNLLDEKVPTKLIHCLLNWGCCAFKCILNDNSIPSKPGWERASPTLRWNLWERWLIHMDWRQEENLFYGFILFCYYISFLWQNQTHSST